MKKLEQATSPRVMESIFVSGGEGRPTALAAFDLQGTLGKGEGEDLLGVEDSGAGRCCMGGGRQEDGRWWIQVKP